MPTLGVTRSLFNLHLEKNNHTMPPGLCPGCPGQQESCNPERHLQREGVGWLTPNLGLPDLLEPSPFLPHLSRSILAVCFWRDHQEHALWTTTQRGSKDPLDRLRHLLTARFRVPLPTAWKRKPAPTTTFSLKSCYENKSCWSRPIIRALLSRCRFRYFTIEISFSW